MDEWQWEGLGTVAAPLGWHCHKIPLGIYGLGTMETVRLYQAWMGVVYKAGH